MNYFQAVIMGIVEGITEFLPISSTGHLILTSNLLGLPQDEFLKSFEIAIQFGAILSVVFLYGRTMLVKAEVLKKIAVAFLPTAIIGFILYEFIKQYLLSSNQVVLWSLFVGGFLIIVFEFFHKESDESAGSVEQMSYRQSFLVGLAQSVAVIPGVSRSAATILGGLLLGVKRKTIVEFSFLLAVPTMAGATGLDLFNSHQYFTPDQYGVLAVGFIVSFFVAIFAIKFLLKFVETHNFTPFGVYRIILALLFWFVIF